MIAHPVTQVPSQHLPVRSKTYPLRDSAKKSRRAKHGEGLDAAELYKRLNELIKQDRGRYFLGHQYPKPNRATISSKPYHHVPQTAARDFTRTTAIKTDRDKPGLLFSQSLPTPNTSAQLYEHRDAWQGPKASSFDLPGSHATVKRSWDAAGLQRSKTSGKERLMLDRYRDRIKGHGENIYDSLVEARIAIRRSSTGDVVSEHLPTIDLGIQPGSHALAHKITRQHLEDKTDCTYNQEPPLSLILSWA
ncbi:hypothetical protein G7Y79_00006g020370 [Physcia stellaris]|nr:hypothetical protein G7Y79_00006g020370 [Physcia stellaris]